ncbi:MAG: hypothetical protein IKX45_08055 [Bacteroidales bacterium]|nr:hypothetical protein [Bacteroidales bacterium]
MKRNMFKLIVLALLLVSCARESKSDFRMMIRLWSDYSDSPEMTDALIDAFRKYDFCDEVWFKAETPATHCRQWHEPYAANMAAAAEKMRKAGVIPSIQGVALGHGDGMTVFDSIKDSTIHWGTMVGPDGAVTGSVNCPRQKAYLARMEEAFVPYVAAVQPHSLYLDDDLRLIHHTPASMGCYCDTCIGEFNTEYGYSFTREKLVKALNANQGDGRLRREWIAFGQESLAGVVRAISRGVHRVSPETRMGLQHANFHRKLMEGWDWKPLFDAMREETGLAPVSRPGSGYYDDHSPRGMIKKGLDISRQIRRLPPEITEIAPEIEAYVHKASGKSSRSLGIETMYYLAMGGTQMSYAIICGSREPLSWYADHYFKELAEVKPFAKEYADFNRGTLPSGIDPYMSPDLVCRNTGPGEDSWAWITTTAGNAAFDLATLGLPFAPEDPHSPVLLLDKACVDGMGDEALADLLAGHSVVVDAHGFKQLMQHGLGAGYSSVEFQDGDSGDYDSPFITPGGRYSDAIARFEYLEKDGKRLLVVPSFSVNLKTGTDYNGAFCLALSHSIDWASGNRLPVVLEGFAQVSIVPRADTEGHLHSVALLNCSLSREENYTLRLRTGLADGRIPRLVWKEQGQRDHKVKAVRDGNDILVTVPGLDGWHFGWLAVESR